MIVLSLPKNLEAAIDTNDILTARNLVRNRMTIRSIISLKNESTVS